MDVKVSEQAVALVENMDSLTQAMATLLCFPYDTDKNITIKVIDQSSKNAVIESLKTDNENILLVTDKSRGYAISVSALKVGTTVDGITPIDVVLNNNILPVIICKNTLKYNKKKDLHIIESLDITYDLIKIEKKKAIYAILQNLLNELSLFYRTGYAISSSILEEIFRSILLNNTLDDIYELSDSQIKGFLASVSASVAAIALSMTCDGHISYSELEDILFTPLLTKRMIKLASYTRTVYASSIYAEDICREEIPMLVKDMEKANLEKTLQLTIRKLGGIRTDDIKGKEFIDKLEENKPFMHEQTVSYIHNEIQRFIESSTISSDPNKARIEEHLDWIFRFPWNISASPREDFQEVRQMLDKSHYGMDEIKRRIIEFLVVRRHVKDPKTPILCLVGPPGTGKTSIARYIATAMGLPLAYCSLAPASDAHFISGISSIYTGAKPGIIIETLCNIGVSNPVFVLDEIDKLGKSYNHGDPASALLPVLDPEQNKEFMDAYLAIKTDISHPLYIATANKLDDIPPALANRMNIVEVPGYLDLEQYEIGKTFLIPKEMENTGLTSRDIRFPSNILHLIINNYVNDAGVRRLQEYIGRICRYVIDKKDSNPDFQKVIVNEDIVAEVLKSPRKYNVTAVWEKEDIFNATVNLLYVNGNGGSVGQMHVGMLSPELESDIITGSLQDVMKESVMLAKYNAVNLIPHEVGWPNLFIGVDEHAIQKDGPSAGVAMTVAIYSLLMEKPINKYIACTGEITMHGHVLPIGGVRDKIMAAVSSGIKTVLLPSRNQVDFLELPETLKRKINVHFIDKVEEAIKYMIID